MCALCSNTDGAELRYYSAATEDKIASCEPCGDMLTITIALVAGGLVALLLLSALAHIVYRRWIMTLAQLATTIGSCNLGVKLKIVVGFWQIASKVLAFT